MGVLSKLFEKRDLTDGSFVDLIMGGATQAGPRVDQNTAMRSTAVYACVRRISESIASLPLVLYRRSDRVKNRATNHPLYPVLHDLANPAMTSFDWRELMFSHVLTWGNGYSEIEYDSAGRVRYLWPLRPDRMLEVVWRGSSYAYRYQLSDGEVRTLPSFRVHHLRGLGNETFGYSPIMLAAREAIGLELAAGEFGSRFFSNGAHLNKVLKHPAQLSTEAYKRLQSSFQADHGGLSNAHRTKILEEGMDIVTLGVPPEAAQFLQTRKFQLAEIARIYNVPLHMLNELDRATFSNIEQQSLEYVIHTLRPWLVRHEQAVHRDLLQADERDNHYAKYVVEGLLRGDTATRYEAYATGINTGFMTRNEARELEDWNPIDGLDDPLIPLNMIEESEAESAPANTEDSEPTESEDSPDERADVNAVEERRQQTARERQRAMQRNVRLYEDAAARLVRREVADIRRAIPRYLNKRSVSDFEQWLGTFYSDLRDNISPYFYNLLLANAEEMFESAAAELDEDAPAINEGLREWVDEYLANYAAVYAVGGEKQLRALLAEAETIEDAESAVNKRLDEWEGNKAQKEGAAQAYEAGNALIIYAYTAMGVAYMVWSGGDCPLCRKLNGRRIRVGDSFLNSGDTLDADDGETTPFTTKRKIKHAPLHRGCDCTLTAG